MNINKPIENKWLQFDIRWLAVLVSLVVSISTLLFQDTPNADAYTYVRTAEIFLSDGIVAAYQHYSWASYSILIGMVSMLGIDLFSAGLLVNAVFYAILIFAFISIMREINDSKFLLGLTALSILIYPQLNEYRGFIIRDIGFWGLSMLALWQYLVYARTQSSLHAFYYCGALFLAATFRAEALAYLILTPFSLLLDIRLDANIRRKLLLRLYAILLSVAVLLLIFLAVMGLNIVSLLLDFFSTYEPFVNRRFTLDEAERELLGSLLFNEYAASYSREYIELFLATGLLAILLANLFNAIGGPYLIVLLTGFVKKQIHLERHIAIPVIFYLAINASSLIAFLFVTRYLSSRYAMLLCLMLALFVPLVIAHVLKNAKGSHLRTIQVLVVLFLSYCAIDSYYSFGDSKRYVPDSIEWVVENVDASSALITNNRAIAYSSGRIESYDKVPLNISAADILSSKEGDIIAAELTFETRQILQQQAALGKVELLTAFPSDASQRIAVYRRIDR